MNQLIVLKENIKGIQGAEDIFKNIKKINIDYKQENFIVFFLDTKNQIIENEVLFKGGLDSCLVCPKTIFRNALKHNASKIIIAHNHPSKDLTPSYEDIDVFKKLKEAGDILQISVLDNIIFNKKEFYASEGGK